MRISILILTVISLASCEVDPNKQVDEGTVETSTYHSKEIGWTMEIPAGWEVTQKEQVQEREDKGFKAIKESTGLDYDISNLKHLISFQKDRFHVFQSTSEKMEVQYEGEWAEVKGNVKQILYNTYTSSGIKVDTISAKEKIDNLEFDVFHITVYGPKGDIILYQDMYNRYINGFDFGVNLNYINEKEKKEMMDVWKNSTFE